MDTSEQAIVGMTVQGRYRLEALLGKGGYGAVYRAKHLKMGNDVAIKVLHATHGESDEIVRRFELEAQRSCMLRHPNTIRVFDFGRADNGQLFLAMEFLTGAPLSAELKGGAKMAPARVVHIISQVLRALGEAHELGLVHRDLKPDNIFLTRIGKEEDFVKVLDFGIAKAVNSGGTGLTLTGAVIGTPKYMSPEQCYGREIDSRSDLYAVGCIMFQMLAGRPPFVADEPMAYLLQHAHEPPPDVRAVAGPDHPIPTGLAELVARLLAKDPDERFASAEETLAALQMCLTGDVTWDYGPTTSQPGAALAARSTTGTGPTRVAPVDTMTGQGTTLTGDDAGLSVPRRRGPLIIAALALLGAGGVAVALALSGGDEAATSRTAVVDATPAAASVTDGSEGASAKAAGAEAVEATAGAQAAGVGVPEPGDRAAGEGDGATTGDKAEAPAADPGQPGAVAPEEVAPAARILSVIVDSDPPLAEVLVGGEPVGVTPYTVKWLSNAEPPPLSLRRRGYEPADVALAVDDAGKTVVTTLTKAKRAASRGGKANKPVKAKSTGAADKPKFTFERVGDTATKKPQKKFDFAPVD